jgi:hypothetical protein
MSYRELADALDIALPAAKARARRGRWAKRQGNDGGVRVAVPVAVLDSAAEPVEDTGSATYPSAISDLVAELKAAYQATEAELRRRAEAAEARLADAEARALRLEVALEESRRPWWSRLFLRRG